MNSNGKEYICINNQNDLNYLIERIENGPLFAEAFKFDNNRIFIELLNYFEIDYKEFKKGYFYFDENRDLHISESEFGYTWISTYGLVAKGKSTRNKFVNSCKNQYTVVSLLFEKAKEICESDRVYDVDGYEFGYLSKLTPALFHNVLFYIEVFGKAYLSLSDVNVPHTHELAKLFAKVNETIYKKSHNDTMFQAHIIAEFEKVVEYIESIPGDFKEHFVKYDDNSEDGTVIRFNIDSLDEIQKTIDMSNDFISSYYYDDDVMYLKSGLLDRLINNAMTEDEKQQIINKYGYMRRRNN
ncbi:hypothetical protein [Halocella sp. SP3-1]|uniref:hypothetical protein n=1 Tax=Halocella sp. SP3-1 TaxID=2382161 RepID=UPI000F765D64|nr:hypothetical protein [Halocella sp. SP3-1]AZO94912.1 hypothetical protein D7D81_10085 [Halocella sp. SP3-1]